MSVPIKEQINNMLGDEMRKVEIDITNSFLNGKITSPLMSTASMGLQEATSIKNNVLNTAASAGIYINKDGLQVDPSVVMNLAGSILNVALETTKMELMNIRNKAWTEITYVPDPSIIMKRAISYFSYYISENMDVSNILDFKSFEDKKEEAQEEKKQTVINKVSYYIDEHLPKVNNAINTATGYITKYCAYATYYSAFGPDWVSDKIAEGIEIGSYAVSYEVSKLTTKVNDFKMEMYNMVGDDIGRGLSMQYEALLKDQVKQLNDEAETSKSKVKIKAQELLMKANTKIMAKTGIKIPIEKISPENLSKIKKTAKLAKLLNIANGNDDENKGGKPADDTSNVPKTNTETQQTETTNEEIVNNTEQDNNEINPLMKNNTFLDEPPQTIV